MLQRHLGLTIIGVTHDPIEAMVLADRVGMSVEGASDPGKPVVAWTRTGNRTVALHFGQLHHLNRQDGTGAVPGKRAANARRVAVAYRVDGRAIPAAVRGFAAALGYWYVHPPSFTG